MTGRLAALYRHPVKGFTPEPLAHADLASGAAFPCDRMYAVERGPCGFNAEAPAHISKQRFTVLANHPRLARAATRYDAAAAELTVVTEGGGVSAELSHEAGREAFAAWLARFLGEDETQPLRVLPSGPSHRFMDDAEGFVSLINLESLRAFAQAVGRPIDPLRMRANLHVDGWAPWAERQARPGDRLRLGALETEVVKPITRCVATHVDPISGERDLEVVALLRQLYEHVQCGLYLRVTSGGRLNLGDPAVFHL